MKLETRDYQGRSDGGISVYIPQNQSTLLQIFMWLLVVVFLFDPGKIRYRTSVHLSSCFFYLLTHHNLYPPKWNSWLRPWWLRGPYRRGGWYLEVLAKIIDGYEALVVCVESLEPLHVHVRLFVGQIYLAGRGCSRLEMQTHLAHQKLHCCLFLLLQQQPTVGLSHTLTNCNSD